MFFEDVDVAVVFYKINNVVHSNIYSYNSINVHLLEMFCEHAYKDAEWDEGHKFISFNTYIDIDTKYFRPTEKLMGVTSKMTHKEENNRRLINTSAEFKLSERTKRFIKFVLTKGCLREPKCIETMSDVEEESFEDILKTLQMKCKKRFVKLDKLKVDVNLVNPVHNSTNDNEKTEIPRQISVNDGKSTEDKHISIIIDDKSKPQVGKDLNKSTLSLRDQLIMQYSIPSVDELKSKFRSLKPNKISTKISNEDKKLIEDILRDNRPLYHYTRVLKKYFTCFNTMNFVFMICH